MISEYNDYEDDTFNNTVTYKREKNDPFKMNKKLHFNQVEDFPTITRNPLIKNISMKEEEIINDNVLKKLKRMTEVLPLVNDEKNDTNKRIVFKTLKRKNLQNFDKILSGNLFGNTLKTLFLDDGFKKKDDERIVIGEKTFLKSNIDLISKAVLKRCNYSHSKNQNSLKSLKKGDGKLMFTNGLTISEFVEKFKSQ